MCARIQSLNHVHKDVLTRPAGYCCVHVPMFTDDGVTPLASAVIISRSSVLLLSTTKANFGPLAPKSKVPRVDGVPGPPAIHVPTAVTRVWGVPLKSPSASRVGVPAPLKERNPM